jgi:RNA polymerase sigma-32 factor
VTSSRQKSLLFALTRMLAARPELSAEDRAYLARRFGVSNAAVDRMSLRVGAHDQSLDASTPGGNLRLIDMLADDRPDPEAAALAADEARDHSRRLAEALAALPERDRRIIARRHLSEEPPLLRELGRGLGVSKERVRQLEKRALERLRQIMQGHAAGP